MTGARGRKTREMGGWLGFEPGQDSPASLPPVF